MEIAKLVLQYIQVLIWPGIVIFIALNFKNETSALLGRIKSAKLPGGVSFDLNEKIQEVKTLSNTVQESVSVKQEENKGRPTIPLTEANTRLIEIGLRPSPSGMDMKYYLNIASQDPNLALAGLRIDVDILVKNLAKGFHLEFDEKRDSTVRILKKLFEYQFISQSQFELSVKVLSLCNEAIHGSPITLEQAKAVIVSTQALIDDYIAWMSWGFNDNWQPQNSN